MENKIVANRKSPKNENSYISAYLEINPKAKKSDGLDIAAVVAKDGTRGHALLPEDVNRGKHSGFHRGKDFISDDELRKKMGE